MALSAIELLPVEHDAGRRRLPLGPGLAVGSQGGHVVSCPVARLAVQVRCTGPVAAVQVVQAFQNVCPETMELTYLFPLPNGAAVSRFRAQVGQRLIEGQIFEKEAAKKQFSSPVRSAFLIQMFEREHQPVFSVSLGVVNPEDTITIELAYAELVPSYSGDFCFTFPLVVTSRLHHGVSQDAADNGARLAGGLVAGPNLAVSVQMESGGVPPNRIACSQNCSLGKLQTGDIAVELNKQGELHQRDFILCYRFGAERAPQCILRHTPRHFVLNLVPPSAPPPATCPRDLVILADVSDNCQGSGRWDAVKKMTAHLLQSIGPGEQFALVGFNDDLAGYKHGDFAAKEEVGSALQWLEEIKPRGRANIKVLMSRILSMTQGQARGLSVVLLAAGHVGNEPEIYSTITLNQTPPGFRVFTVGIDGQVSVPFLRRMAGWTRGTSFFTAADEPTETLAWRLVEETRYPLINDVMLVDQGLGLMPETFYPLNIPGLGGAQPVSLLGLKNGNGPIEVRGKAFSGHAWGEAAQPIPCQNPALGFVWAQQKVREMQDELKLTSGPKASRMRQIVMDLSQEYRIYNDFTAYALVEPQAVSANGGPGGSLLPSLTPYEWKDEMATPELTPGEGGRTRLNKRIHLAIPEQGHEVQEVVSEPAKVKPQLIGPEPSASGLKPKEQIFSDKPKREKKPSLPTGPKIKETKASLVKKGGGDSGPKGMRKPVLPRPNSGEKPTLVVDAPVEVQTAGPNGATGKRSMPARPVLATAQQQGASGSLAVAEESVEEVGAAPEAAAPPAPVGAPAAAAAPAGAPPADGQNHENVARDLLKSNTELRAALMADMRSLYQAIGKAAQTGPDQTLLGFLERILRRIQPVIEQSVMLKEVYRVGVLCYKAIQAKDPQALAKTQHWIQKFATLFQ